MEVPSSQVTLSCVFLLTTAVEVIAIDGHHHRHYHHHLLKNRTTPGNAPKGLCG